MNIKFRTFSELIGKGHFAAFPVKTAERPLPGGVSIPDLRREDLPAANEPPRFRPGESEPEPAERGDELPCWQPGATDPLALFGLGNLGVAAAAPVVPAPAALDPLVSQLLRSIAWGGDRRRGTARLELGAGRYRGLSVKVEAVGDGLQIDLEAPAGVDAAALGARLVERFEARGLRVDSLTCR